MKVMILGCGPAGLMAAAGVDSATLPDGQPLQVMIVSRKVKSALHGAQYLHEPIPGFTTSGPRRIDYRLDGPLGGYREKVYGQLWDGKVSPEDLTNPHDGWDIRETYEALWRSYASWITDVPLTPVKMHTLIEEHKPDLIINSVPLPALCYRGHAFGATEIIAAGDAPSLGIRIPFSCPDEHVICNGNDNPSWYRMSRVFGHTTVEWPGAVHRVPITSAALVKKPTFTDCDCWPDWKMVGRYGKWTKGVLSHTAYADAKRYVEEAASATAQAGA